MKSIFSRTDAETNRQTLRLYKQEMRGERKALTLALTLMPLQELLVAVIVPLLISFFTQSLIVDTHNISTPLWLLGGITICVLVAVFAGRVGFITLFNHQERMTTKLAERALRSLLTHSHSFFADSKVGSLAGDINSFSRSYLSMTDAVLLQSRSVIVNFIASLVVIAFIAPIMLPVLILLTVAVIGDSLWSYAKRAEYRNQRKNMQSRLFGNIADILSNQTLVRMFGHSDREVHSIVRERQAIEGVARKEIRIIQSNAERRLVILFGFQIAALLLCLYLITNSMLTIAALIFIIAYLGRVTGSMFQINVLVRSLEQAFLDAAKITEILQKTPEVLDVPKANTLTLDRADIELRDVMFAYADASENTVFTHLNLAIPSGQSIGLVGKSGGGKSTFTHLLLRYMDIERGEITIDSQNIATVSQDSLRQHIAYVPQDPFLFHRTLRENIAYGKLEATDKEVIEAAKKANAWEFIQDLPMGLDTVVGERGIKLSGGQRQRIAIARAILKDSPILILDEATSALDSESEKLIQQSLATLMKDRTSIVIAHRLSTIAKLDRIIVLDHGKIVEDGTHKELLEQKGIYAKLWNHQSGGFIEE